MAGFLDEISTSSVPMPIMAENLTVKVDRKKYRLVAFPIQARSFLEYH